MPQVKPQWDVFCKIVDNFGDIGVCWRLARQLVKEHGIHVSLWIDDLIIAQKIIPNINHSLTSQSVEGVTIRPWQDNAKFEHVAEVVIEAFGCGLPPSYLAKMQPNHRWVNLEYLSAESWVEDFHGRHAVHGNLKRYFYFPGFVANTGGLIRENDLPQSTFEIEQDSLNVSLFCYQNAPIQSFFSILSASQYKTTLFVPFNSHLQQYAEFFKQPAFQVGNVYTSGNLTLKVLPFLSQDEYDALLRACDINFVRGEDSWLRAIWAGKPMIWQPYVQEKNIHIKKLNAFLDMFYASCDTAAQAAICKMYRSWTSGTLVDSDWINVMQHKEILNQHARTQKSNFSKQPDLASKLVIFCNNL
ncbi:MAG: elongation factor P maturation arginine rhamnosyltransferase EarP [Methylophilus sp.]